MPGVKVGDKVKIELIVSEITETISGKKYLLSKNTEDVPMFGMTMSDKDFKKHFIEKSYL